MIEAARITSPPATSEAISVLASDSRLGDRPPNIAATWFSDAARVANPKRDQRYSAASAAAAATTIPVRMKRSTGMTAPSSETGVWGRTPGSFCGVVPNASTSAGPVDICTPS